MHGDSVHSRQHDATTFDGSLQTSRGWWTAALPNYYWPWRGREPSWCLGAKFLKSVCQLMNQFGPISEPLPNDRKPKIHQETYKPTPTRRRIFGPSRSPTRRFNFSRGPRPLSLLVEGLSHPSEKKNASQIGFMFSDFQGESLVSGSGNTNQSGSDTQVRDHKWVLHLSLDDDDGGCNKSTEHLAVGNCATDQAIGARRTWYSSPSNSSRVKAPTSMGKE